MTSEQVLDIPYADAAASQVAQRLDTEILRLLRHATGIPAIAAAARRSPQSSTLAQSQTALNAQALSLDPPRK